MRRGPTSDRAPAVSRTPSPPGRLAPWQRLLLAAVLVGAALHAARPLWNTDYFWHVSSGRLYLETGSLPEHDPFTYTAGESAWVHHEWLSQIVLAVVEDAAGLGGARLLRSALVTAGLGLLFVLVRRRVGDGAAIGVVAVACLGLLPNAGLRPHLVTWPLLVAVLAGLLPALLGDDAALRRKLWLLLAYALAVVLWVNLHSSALIVPLLTAAAAGGAAADRLVGLRPGWRPAIERAGLATLAAAACLLQPAGARLFAYALETPDVNLRSEEWGRLLDAADAPATRLAWAVLVVAAAACAVLERRRRKPLAPPAGGFADFWVAAACLFLAFEHRRMALFLFLPALYVARFAVPFATAFASREEIRPSLSRALRWLTVAVAASWALTKVPDALSRDALRPGLFPEAATSLLEQADVEGRLFHDINWGGYLGYRRYPAQQVYADGRWLLVGPQVMADMPRLYLRDAPPAEVDATFERYGVEVLVQPTRDLLRLPAVDPARWRLAWTDPVATVLLRRGPAFDGNAARLCALYARLPGLDDRLRWPVRIERDDGFLSPTDIPALVDACPLTAG